MNAPDRPGDFPARHRLTIPDVLKMQEAGILGPDHGCELIDGELLEMPSEGERHARLKLRLIRFFNRALGDDVDVGPDTTLWLADDQGPEPDLFLFPSTLGPAAVRGQDTLLVVEIADTSLRYDLGEKADLYRRFGVREYWVIDADASVIHVDLLDAGGQWAKRAPVGFDTAVTLSLLPVSVRLADLI
ncbi:MAG: Uma2 family endonuclease [Hyphomonadaceae bacterium]|nr:Uma2 family endonuclease [Hyphomonadaceae bacterium]